ncbi:MAG TPA: DUF362 domain-containing protein [Candidatus Aminicenantes bacterium]|nr:DUF362 domain-containing protein [Candidatus Aminicenantes bacterium]
MGRPRVVVVKSSAVWTPAGTLDPAVLARMFARGLADLTGERDSAQAAAAIFRPGERVGIKVNTIGGRAISTRPEVARALAAWIAGGGTAGRDILVWDRTSRELRDAGYAISTGRSDVRVFGTDAGGAGYENSLTDHLDVGSLFSRILTEFVDASVSLAILKDHGLAGLTAGMKNYFGAIHNPNKYHDDGCDPFVAQVFDAPPVKSRHRLTVVDALTVQFHRGPSYHARWAAKFGGLIFSRDPVAADHAGWAVLERLRRDAGLPTLEAEGREPSYLRTAERMGLGTSAAEVVETVVGAGP